jgi:putative heme-binding domain-containing protein
LLRIVEPVYPAPDARRGREIFAAVGCFVCHTYAGEGGALGPDLTGVAGRFGLRDLLEAIVEPHKEISDQYGTVEIALRDGRRLTGRIVNHSADGVTLAENLFDPGSAVLVRDSERVSVEPSKTSLMPAGMLDALRPDEIRDLVAFLRGGDARPTPLP